MSNNAPQASEKTSGKKTPRVVTIRLRLPVFITGLVLFLAGLTWVFFLGVLAGRGYHTEEQIGALAAFMPAQPVAEATGSMNLDGREGAGDLNALFANGELLRGEDLDFKGSLRAPTEGSSTAETKPELQVTPITPASEGAGGAELIVASPSEPLYEYVYQVSALNQQHQAQALKQRLTEAGITAQIELHKTQDTTWYRVLVSFKGNNSELPSFINRLEQLNLKQPLLRKKQVISG